MSSPNNADVIQGRLGWEDGDISEADPEELEPHPKNEEIYGDTKSAADLDGTFINSVREKGVLEPLVITNGKQIISGHRRWLAAKATDTDRVPVRKSEFDSDLAEREALIEFNRQREKTPGQIVNEFEEMEEIEKRRLDEKGQTTQGRPPKALKDLDTGGNVSTSSEESINEKARRNAAKKIDADISGRTLEKGLKVKEKAESEDEPEEVRETARQQWEDLQQDSDTSFHSAYTAVKDAEREVEKEPETETPDLPDETYRAIVIDPPWDIKKIEREERPDQGKFLDYPTMDISELAELPVSDLAADSGAHLYVWTTQKHLPDALGLVESWGGRYECLLTWVKPTGVAPFSWQYNTEHVVFARFGDGLKLDQRAQQLSFEAPVREHSAKPDVFFERVREATPAPRLNMFARSSRDGFDVWGDEAPAGGDVDGR